MTITNRLGLSSVFVIALQRAMAEYRNVGWRSATGLIDSPRQKILLERHHDEITMDVSDGLRLLEGVAMHDLLANLGAYEPQVVTEKPIILHILGKPIKMQADRIEPVPHVKGEEEKWILKDFKRTKCGAWKAGGRSSWTAQGNIYKLGYHAMCDLNIVQVQFELILSDWHEAEVVKHDYPPHPIMPLEVDLWTLEETKEYLEDRVRLFAECEELDDDNLPDCTPIERWSRPDLWGVWNKNGKTAKPYRQFKNQADALEFIPTMKNPDNYEVKFRPGESVRCGRCEVKDFCKFCRKKEE